VAIGGNCLQIFSSAPQQWKPQQRPESEYAAFRTACTTHDITPVVIHAKYLINLGTDDAFLLSKSVASAIDDMVVAHHIGALGIIVHFGSNPHRWVGPNQKRYITMLHQILKETPDDVSFLFENSAGGGNTIGTTLEELHAIADDFPESRVGFCIDTCHAFAMGYDLRSRESVDAFVAAVDTAIGWDRVKIIHANDAKEPLGSHRDRHENIGMGQIGSEGFTALLTHPKLQKIPWILEVPGTDRSGPDKENIDRLQAYLHTHSS
jgi:deoxyribonuclease-4